MSECCRHCNHGEQKGQPIGLLLRGVDADEIKARLDAGEHLFVKVTKK